MGEALADPRFNRSHYHHSHSHGHGRERHYVHHEHSSCGQKEK
jgi:hypothetical protein